MVLELYHRPCSYFKRWPIEAKFYMKHLYRGGSRISEEEVQMWKKGGSFASFYTKCLEILHENEIIWLHRGV